MSAELQNRAKAWLSQPLRRTPDYAHDSMADWFIGVYASNGQVDLSGDWIHYLRAGVSGSLQEAEGSSGQDAIFFREAAEILRAIEAEGQVA
jgi:hypothetical protein